MEKDHLDLVKKLGLKPNQEAFSLHAPPGYSQLLPEVLPLSTTHNMNQTMNWVHAFYLVKSEFEKEIELIKSHLSKDGQLWISWPKHASAVKSDLNDNLVRQIGLNAGLVDVRIAAIDSTWSALKFVYRLADR